MAQQVPLFNQTHPDIHVTWQNVGAGPVEYNKLFTAVKANNAPDVAEVEFQTLPQFATTGSLVDVSKYGGNSVKDQFPSWMWNEVNISSGVYAIPQDGGPMALFYREDIFKKYNLPVPTTWAQYADDAAKLHAAAPNVYITDFPPRQPGQFTGYVWQNGGHLFTTSGQSWKVSINSPQALQVAAYWQDLIDKKLVKTEPDFTNAWFNDLQTERLPPGSPAPGAMASSNKMRHRPRGSGGLLPCPSGRRVKPSVATGVAPRPSSSRIRSIRRRPVRSPNGSVPTSRVPYWSLIGERIRP